MQWSVSDGSRLPISTAHSSIITARSDKACRRRCMGQARPSSTASRSSRNCSNTDQARYCSPGPTAISARHASTPTASRSKPTDRCCGVPHEAELTLRAYGFAPRLIADVGVAGLHRLLARVDDVTSADAVICVAGMEGALASVIGGLTAGPVVAVPTSVGYGAGLEGVTALLAMHASCASGISVVGIDNGFGAACAIARMCS
jgi:hypothetical protein